MKTVIYLSDFRRERTFMRKTQEEINSAVTTLCRQYNVDVSDVDVIALAKNMGLRIEEVEFKEQDISGVLSKVDNTYVISINKQDTYTRKRFTIAHEIGHYVLGHLNDASFNHMEIFRKSGQKDDKEVDANKFAATLLIDKQVLKNVCFIVRKLKDRSSKISLAADFFDVSKSTLEYRIKNLGLEI